MEEGDIVICENAEDCEKKRCPHYDEHECIEECWGHFCEKHLADRECDEVD